MAGQLRPVVQQDFSGGINIVTSPYVLGPAQSAYVLNFVLDEHGALRVRDGSKALYPGNPHAADSYPVTFVGDFVSPGNPVPRLAIVQGPTANFVYRIDFRGTGGTGPDNPWVLLATFDTAYDIPQMLVFLAQAFFAAGYEKPWLWDGTTFSRVTSSTGPVPAGAKHASVHAGYYWLWNTAALSTSVEGPCSLRASDVNVATSWPLANQLFVDKDDGDVGTGIGQFTIAEVGIAPTQVQILFKHFAAYEVVGVFGSTNPTFSVQRIKSDMGCIAPRTIQFVAGFGIIRMTHRGIAVFNGVEDQLVSEEVRPLLFGGSGYTGVDFGTIGKAYAVSIQNPPMYICFLPDTASGQLTLVLCYDLIRKAWTVLKFPNATASATLIEDAGSLPLVLVGDAVNGNVRQLFQGDADDDGTAVSWLAAFRPVSGGSPQRPAYFRRLILKVSDVAAADPILVRVVFGPMVTATPPLVTQTLTPPVAVPQYAAFGSGWGFDAWGTSPYGGALAAPVIGPEVDLTMDLGRTGTNARLVITGTGKLRVRGVEWHVKPKALARASVYA